MKNLSMSVTLYCPTCGNDQFSTIDVYDGNLRDADGSIRFKCSDCGLIISKEDLIDQNQNVINANVEDLEDEMVKELNLELKKALKKWK